MSNLTTAAAVVYSTLFLFGVPGNAWVLWKASKFLFRKPSGQWQKWPDQWSVAHRVHFHILILSVVDILVLSVLSMLITDILLNQHWPFGTVLCKVYWSIENIMKFLSISILTFMSADRYLTLKHSGKPLSKVASVCFGIVTTLVTVALITPAALTATVFRIPTSDGGWTNRCSPDFPSNLSIYTFICGTFILGFVLPAIFITYFYSMIAYIAVKHSRNFPSSQVNSTKVMMSLVKLVLFYYCCWTPYWIANFTVLFGGTWAIKFSYICHSLPYLNSAANWVLYALLNNAVHDSTATPSVRSTSRSTCRPPLSPTDHKLESEQALFCDRTMHVINNVDQVDEGICQVGVVLAGVEMEFPFADNVNKYADDGGDVYYMYEFDCRKDNCRAEKCFWSFAVTMRVHINAGAVHRDRATKYNPSYYCALLNEMEFLVVIIVSTFIAILCLIQLCCACCPRFHKFVRAKADNPSPVITRLFIQGPHK